ncbi:MAG TPA: Clp protease N-terminal domain-containing protein [Tepidisphaeraceae bacterium]|jgi:ATP-dependent Clp protease ATP-binding subunit ClpC|nr:Clp protease N-terminal domain-containing protein [Tepidisphaeraceae bacterium]
MREDLTDTLRNALQIAQQEARLLNQDFVGTEHLLLGMLGCGTCEAGRALEAHHVPRAKLREALMKLLPKGEQEPVVVGDLPFSPRAQRLINGAIVKAQAMRQPKVSTRFVMLSILDEPQSLARDALKACGADTEHLERTLAQDQVEVEQ